MSDFLAEARVVIRPDTTRFRAELQAQVLAAAKNVTVPVAVTAVASTGAASTAASQLAASTVASTAAVQQQTAALQKQGVAVGQMAAKTKDLTKQQDDFRRGIVASAASLTGLRGAVLSASSPFLVAAVSAAAFGKAVSSAADLETELNVFRVTAGATADEMERVGEEAKALGRDLTLPGVTATDAAQSFLALSRAGLSVKDSIDGARGVLQLAVAAQIGFADAAQLTASALNAFALDGADAVEVADLLTNAANQSQASISDMGIALRQSAAIADLAGFSLSETATFLTQLAQAGLAGSDAGTSFRVAIQRLIAPTGAARKELDRLNINLRDAAGNLRPEAFFELGDALERLGRAQGDATRQLIFGNDASRAAAFFARINAQAFREQETSLKRQGAAAEVAGARNEGFAGSVENLKNQLTALGIEIGELALPVLGTAADITAQFFGALATQISDSRDALSGFGDDAEKLQEFLSAISDDSGFTEFVGDVASGATLLAGDIKRASDAADAFTADLLGIGGQAGTTAPQIHRLTEEERRLAETAHDSHHVFETQVEDLDNLADAASRAAASVARLQGQEAGLQEQAQRARIAGDVGGELDAQIALRDKLERELAQQEAIIAQPGGRGEATARNAIRNRILPELETVNNEIQRILDEQESANKDLADQAARAASERDRAIVEAFAQRRGDAERRISAAGDTQTLVDDIQRQNQFQRLIKQQIAKLREQVADEKLRRAMLRELRLALQASQREEDALRRERRAQAIEQRATGLELDIELADINENDARRVALRKRRIAQLKREARELNLQGNALKENRNERARIRKEIEEILKEEEKGQAVTKSLEQLQFEFMQKQTGFASNLLGNLIPGFATGGLVGNISTATGGFGQPGGPQPGGGVIPGMDVSGQIASASALASAGGRGVRPVQVDTTNQLLRQILRTLQNLSGRQAHPEARRQRETQGASMDTFAY